MAGKVTRMKIQSGLKLAEDKINRKDIMQELVQFRRMHGWLLILTFLLISFGLVMMFSVSLSASLILSSQTGDSPSALYFFSRQLTFTALGIVAMLIIGRFIHVRSFNRPLIAAMVYGVTTILLILVRRTVAIDGAQRWLRIAGLSLQPSELAKIAAVFCLAFYFSWVRSLRSRGAIVTPPRFAKYAAIYHSFIDFTLPALAMGLWLFLILIQPHLSGAIIFSLVVISCFLVAKIPLRSWLGGGLQCLALLLALVMLAAIVMPFVSKESLPEFVGKRFAHVSRRLATHENPDEATDDELYHVRQARLAMGAGGLTGVGFGQGRQKFNYLPMIYNDYMFPAMGEELGFRGTSLVLLGFLLFMWFGLNITVRANSLFALIVAWGYTMLITVQALLHMVVTLGLVPATGISLPFFSYGGSSNFFFLVAVGLILSVSRTAQRSPKELRIALGQVEKAPEYKRTFDRNVSSATRSRASQSRKSGVGLFAGFGTKKRKKPSSKAKRRNENYGQMEGSQLDYPVLEPRDRAREQGSSSSAFSQRGFARSRSMLEQSRSRRSS